MKISAKFFKCVEYFKYIGKTLTNQNCIRKEIRSDGTQGMLAIIRCRIFYLPDCDPKIRRLKYAAL
jgi:hypothetical protein